MTGTHGRVLEAVPPSVVALLDGSEVDESVGWAVSASTVDDDGWPRCALLSAGELLLRPDGGLALAVYGGSTTASNLRRVGRVVLALAVDGALVELAFRVTEGPPVHGTDLATFAGPFHAGREHRVPYARVTSGVRFALEDRSGTVARWRRQIHALRTLSER